jgi:hypothetical protein
MSGEAGIALVSCLAGAVETAAEVVSYNTVSILWLASCSVSVFECTSWSVDQSLDMLPPAPTA